MIGCSYRHIWGRSLQHLAYMQFFTAKPKARSKVEIAIVEIAIPGDRELRAAHKTWDIGLIKRGTKFHHVAIKIPGCFEPTAETPQGNVGQREQFIENDSIPGEQILPEFLYQLRLVCMLEGT